MAGKSWNGLKWLEIAGNGWKLLEMAEISGMAGNGWKWLGMAENGWNWWK